MGRTKLIYLLGAGRSGTTVLSTLLNAHPGITTVGEMHQFYDHLIHAKPCACGEGLNTCIFWGGIIPHIPVNENTRALYGILAEKESHLRIPFYLLGGKANEAYYKAQHTMFDAVRSKTSEDHILDSSKYIARYLLLRQDGQIDIKGIYVVRDVRGVIKSFRKKVQTTKGPISTILYHSLINLFGQIVCWMDPKVIKIRYEDLMTDADGTLSKIQKHIFGEDSDLTITKESYVMPHIIGGNRMKSSQQIRLKFDQEWKSELTRIQQLIFAFLTAPFMLVNRYPW